MANKGGSSSGIKGFVSSGLVLLILVSSLVGWAKVNDVNSVSSGYDYFKAWSDKLWSCGAGDARIECEGDGGIKLPDGIVPNPDTKPNPDGSTGTPSENENNSGSPSPVKPPATTKDADLDSLSALATSEEQNVDYERSQWKHWVGTPCDTRETVLFEQGKDVTKDPSNCKVLSGTWVDPYGGETFTDAGALDIDHVIPLGYVAKHGGQDWSAEKKQQFANDKTQLLAASAKENRSKSDKGPEKYMPPRREFQCEYSKIWVSTATKYGITVTEGDKRALKAGLQKC